MFSCSLDNYDRYTLVGEPFVFKWQWLTGLDKVNNETLLSLLKLGFHSVFLQRGNYRRKKKPTKMPAKLKKKKSNNFYPFYSSQSRRFNKTPGKCLQRKNNRLILIFNLSQ